MKGKKAAKPRQGKLYRFRVIGGFVGVDTFLMRKDGFSESFWIQIKGQKVLRRNPENMERYVVIGELDKFAAPKNTFLGALEGKSVYTYNRRLAYLMLAAFKLGYKASRGHLAEKIRACLREPLEE